MIFTVAKSVSGCFHNIVVVTAMVGNSPSNGPFRHAFHYTLPSENDTQHAINTHMLNEYSIYNVNIWEYFMLRVCTAYCIVGHSPPLYIMNSCYYVPLHFKE